MTASTRCSQPATTLATALIAPLLGAIADQSGRQKPWLLVFSMLCIAATASLWFVRPEESDVVFALLVYGVAVLGFEMTLVFYNAMLPELAGSDRVAIAQTTSLMSVMSMSSSTTMTYRPR